MSRVPVRTWTAVVAVTTMLALGWAAPSVAGEPGARPGGVSLTSPEAVQVMAGERATVAGEITPARKGTPVSIQQQRRGKWTTIATTKTGNGGSFSAAVRFTKAGVYKIRASASKAGTSAPMQVIVLGWYYLADLPVVSGRDDQPGPIRMNGRVYPRSIIQGVSRGSETIEWDLQRRCSRLVATAGMGDSDTQDAAASLQFAVDQAQVADLVVSFGTTSPVGIDVSGGLRLVFTATQIQGPARYVTVGLGDARLACLPLQD